MKYELTGKSVLLNEKNNTHGFEYTNKNKVGLLGDSNCSSYIPAAIDEILSVVGADELPPETKVKITIELV